MWNDISNCSPKNMGYMTKYYENNMKIYIFIVTICSINDQKLSVIDIQNVKPPAGNH